jgi:predicted metal-dependent HD superfamily phosphohydrolase
MNLRHEYEALWKRMGGKTPADFRLLEILYSIPLRHHHTLEDHIIPMLEEFEPVASMAAAPDAIRMSIYWHDAIYYPLERDNEEQSARVAYSVCSDGGLIEAQNVKWLVRSTKQHKPGDLDAMLLSDCDYAVLGKPWERFLKYNKGVDAEYGWLKTSPESWKTYVGRRKAFLESLKQGVFLTPYFIEKYEAQARSNIERAIKEIDS